MSDEPETQPKHAAQQETFSTDILEVDDRLVRLERHDREMRVHVVNLQDVLIDQIITVGVLELAFALFICMMVWDRYREDARGHHS